MVYIKARFQGMLFSSIEFIFRFLPLFLICIIYLQQPPPKPNSGPPFPPLQQQRRSIRTGSRHPHPQILSIIPLRQPFLHKQIMRMIISIQRQQLSPIPGQFNILCISSCKIRSVSAIIISIFFTV